MAKNKVELELSLTEARHLGTAIEGEQMDHNRRLGRRNPALSRVQSKVDKALALAESVDLKPVEDKPVADDPEADETASTE